MSTERARSRRRHHVSSSGRQREVMLQAGGAEGVVARSEARLVKGVATDGAIRVLSAQRHSLSRRRHRHPSLALARSSRASPPLVRRSSSCRSVVAEVHALPFPLLARPILQPTSEPANDHLEELSLYRPRRARRPSHVAHVARPVVVAHITIGVGAVVPAIVVFVNQPRVPKTLRKRGVVFEQLSYYADASRRISVLDQGALRRQGRL
mmetsp:Transcript_21879/g.70687  ORF Transcript_21879/g.70687 Transcript_21879/m.70687 type:complete len:209 (-) Transcript_21879:19-645(-)